jgi:hypothetical protein
MTDDLVDEVVAFITARDWVTFMELKSFSATAGPPPRAHFRSRPGRTACCGRA